MDQRSSFPSCYIFLTLATILFYLIFDIRLAIFKNLASFLSCLYESCVLVVVLSCKDYVNYYISMEYLALTGKLILIVDCEVITAYPVPISCLESSVWVGV